MMRACALPEPRGVRIVTQTDCSCIFMCLAVFVFVFCQPILTLRCDGVKMAIIRRCAIAGR